MTDDDDKVPVAIEIVIGFLILACMLWGAVLTTFIFMTVLEPNSSWGLGIIGWGIASFFILMASASRW